MILYRTLAPLLRPTLRALYRIEGSGWERIPARGPAVLVANHESMIDPFILGVAARRPIHYMAKAELWDYALLRPFMNGFGTFPVRRGRGDAGAVETGVDLLRRGELVGVFPQGTSLPYRHRPWFRGAARLAIDTGAPLVPVCLIGTERALRPHKLRLGLPEIRIQVAEPIDPTGARPKELTAEAERRVDELRAGYGPPQHVWLD